MMKTTMVMAAFAAAISARGEVELSTAADRVESPLRVDMKCVGTLAPRSVKDIRSSNSSFGTKDMTLSFYEFPRSRQLVHSGGVTFVNVPVYDSPCVLTERGVVLK